MNFAKDTHPTRRELSDFGSGRLNSVESDAIEQHLAECPECCETLKDLPSDDTFVSLLQAETDTSVSSDVGPVIPETIVPETGQETRPPQSEKTQFAAPSKTDLELPRELREHPRYRIVELLGRGGMGDVYRAEHKVMNRQVALKVIKPQLVQNDAAVRRFQREVQAAAQLHHGNIVTAFDAEQAGDLHYLVMEFVDGVDLDEVIRERGALPVEEACDYIRQAAGGLQYAHELGMVHRDIKPHNLMVRRKDESGRRKEERGEEDSFFLLQPSSLVKILDFGLANFANEVAEDVCSDRIHAVDEHDESGHYEPMPGASILHQLTQMGTMMGTPDYIAPEQAEDAHTADIRSDIYSLGCTFYTLLTGKAPFGEGSVLDKVRAHTHEDAPPLSEVRDDVPEEVESILNKMMAKDPAERYQTPAEVAEALASVAASFQLEKAEEKDRQAGSSSPRRRRPLILTAVATLFLALLAAAATIFYIQSDNGVVRVEVTDPSLEVTISGQTITTDDNEKPLTIRAGEQKLIVRQADSEFELVTDSFQLRRGDRIALKVELLPGEVVVSKNGRRFDSGVLGSPSSSPISVSVADLGPPDSEDGHREAIVRLFNRSNKPVTSARIGWYRDEAATSSDKPLYPDFVWTRQRGSLKPGERYASTLTISRPIQKLSSSNARVKHVQFADGTEWTAGESWSEGDPVDAEWQRLAGRWQGVSGASEGREMDRREAAQLGLIVDAEKRMMAFLDVGDPDIAEVDIQPLTSPKRIDIASTDGVRPETMLGIYKLEADELTLCLAEGGRRPSAFTTVAGRGGGSQLLVFRRDDSSAPSEIPPSGKPSEFFESLAGAHLEILVREQAKQADPPIDTVRSVKFGRPARREIEFEATVNGKAGAGPALLEQLLAAFPKVAKESGAAIDHVGKEDEPDLSKRFLSYQVNERTGLIRITLNGIGRDMWNLKIEIDEWHQSQRPPKDCATLIVYGVTSFLGGKDQPFVSIDAPGIHVGSELLKQRLPSGEFVDSKFLEPQLRQAVEKNPALPVVIDVRDEVAPNDPRMAAHIERVRRIVEAEGAFVRLGPGLTAFEDNQIRVVYDGRDRNAVLIVDGERFVQAVNGLTRIRKRFAENAKLVAVLDVGSEIDRTSLEDLMVVDSVVKMIAATGVPVRLAPALQVARETAWERNTRTNALNRIGIALHTFAEKHQLFPPGDPQKNPDWFDDTGRPHLSWRVHLLPIFDRMELYERFRVNEPWDSPHNKSLLAEMPAMYKTTDDPTKTTLLAVVGEGTAYEGKAGLSLKDFKDGMANTALVVDAGRERAVPWTKPEDLPFAPQDPIRVFGTSDFGDVFLALMADCSVRSIPYDTAPESLRALFTRAAGDTFDENAKRTTPLPQSAWPRGNPDDITLERKFGGRVPVKGLAFLSDSHVLAVASGGVTGSQPELHVWDLEAGRVQVAIPLPFDVRTTAVSADHKFVLVAENKQGPGAHRIARFNLDTLKLSPDELAKQPEKVWVQSLIPPDRKSYEILQLKLEPAWTISLEQAIEELKCFQNSEAFLVRDHRGRVALYGAEDGGFVSELAAAKVEAMSLAPDGKLLLVKYEQGGGHLLRAEDGFKVNELKVAATSRVTATDWCADGRCVITADAAGQISVWNLATGEAVHSFSTVGEPIANVLIDPNRERIYSSSERGIAVWDLTGQLLAWGEAPPFRQASLALSPDQKSLLSGGRSWHSGASKDDHSLRLWQLPESVWPEK